MSFLQRESRFLALHKKDPEVAEPLWQAMNKDVHHRMDHLLQLSADYKSFDHPDDAAVMTLFASETGTAARAARDFSSACTLSSTASAMDDIEVDELDGRTTVFFISTCGQGAMPQNGRRFLKDLQARKDYFKEGTCFMVFGLGDSSYFFYVKAAKEVESRMVELGAKQILPLGAGDDLAEEGMEEGLHDWLERVWPSLELSPPSEVPHITPVHALFSERALMRPEDEQRALAQFFNSDSIKAVRAPVVSNDHLCRPTYNRDFRTIRIGQDGELKYELGDALEIFPQNDPDQVADFLLNYSKEYDEGTVIKLHAFGIDGDISLGALLTYVLDLFGKPTKHLVQQLATFETDEAERKTMLEQDFLKKAAKENGITIADTLLRFRKAQPPLPALFGNDSSHQASGLLDCECSTGVQVGD
jgi:sulfite reductase alpha subunit-like flavoprotein